MDISRRSLLASAVAVPLPGRALTVFAAASLTDALSAIAAEYRRQTGTEVRFSFAASSAIARQIAAGAPADLFVSADEAWMDYAAERRLIRPSSRIDIVGNRLVLIAPAASSIRLRIDRNLALAAALGPRGRMAIADPETVPAGRYAKAALTHFGLWPSLAGRLAPAENVRSALMFVARGETPLGVVYQSDAVVEPKVRVLDVFPAASHPPIVYPAALTTRAPPHAAAFLAYLRAAKARALFRRFGFLPL
jgi:molybdate transport system substrate-binding protein